MKWILPIVVLVLSGCVTPEQRYAQGVQECTALANQYNLQDNREAFIHRCALIQPGGGGLASGTTAYGGSAYGRPDAFGPYGVWGPTWGQFNQVFTPPPASQFQPITPAPVPGPIIQQPAQNR